MPGNPKLLSVIQRKSLELADLKPEDIAAIMQFEEQKQMMAMQAQQSSMLQDPSTVDPAAQQQPLQKPLQNPLQMQ